MIYLIIILTVVFSNQFYAQLNEDVELELVHQFEKTQVKFIDEKIEPRKLIDENLIFVKDLIRNLIMESELANYPFKALIDMGHYTQIIWENTKINRMRCCRVQRDDYCSLQLRSRGQLYRRKSILIKQNRGKK